LIYLDHNATTPVRREAQEATSRALSELPGNPSSVHAAGRQARAAVEGARAEVASLVGVTPEELVFCSGGTEGDNWAIRSLARLARARSGRSHLVSSRLEHPAVQETVLALASEGFSITWLAPLADGNLRVEDLTAAVGPTTALVSLAAANHELGNVYPVSAFARVAHAAGALFHTDAVQAAGKIPLALSRDEIDAATFSSHKLYGPKGVGAVYMRRTLDPDPLLIGGHQERERRAGTENLPGIVGFGVAARAAAGELAREEARLAALRDELERGLLALPGARRHGPPPCSPRLAGTLNVGFDDVPGQLLAVSLDLEGICVSTGAACTSGSLRPSPVLLALGLPEAAAAEGVRLSLGRGTTREEILHVLTTFPTVLERIRAARRATRRHDVRASGDAS